MSKARTPSDDLKEISPQLLYPLSRLMKISGLGEAALRQARRRGLDVRYVGNRAFVHGKSFIDFVLQSDQGTGVSDTTTDP